MISAKELRTITATSDSYLDMILSELEPKLKEQATLGKSQYDYKQRLRGDTTPTEATVVKRYSSTVPTPPMWQRLIDALQKEGYSAKMDYYKVEIRRSLDEAYDDPEYQTEAFIKISW